MIKFCLHCGENVKNAEEEFCCLGCVTAYKIINKLGLKNYYELRQINPSIRKIKPEIAEEIDVTEFACDNNDGSFSLSLIVQGLHCAACVWLIETILKKQKNIITARINLAKKTLFLRFFDEKKIGAKAGNEYVHLIHEIGYKLLPFDEEILKSADKKYNDSILRALAVAGFGVGNVMLFSFSLWFSDVLDMGVETRNLFHFFSSLIALPIIAYCARPFFSSAFKSIKAGYPNMDLAISIAIFLACAVSLLETFRGASHVYFDSAIMLIFFLLIGRYLDLRARKKAFAVASEFMMLSASFGRIEEDSKIRILPSRQLQKDMILLVAAGEKIAADGIIIEGESEIDTSLITGESLPRKIGKADEVYAGMINLNSPLKIKITKSAQNSLLSKIIEIVSEGESKKNHYVRLADRLSKFYTPAVHILAFLTFLLWCFYFQSGWEIALMNATAVLIITCPCALALAIPIIQTIVISNFVKKGILIKSGEVLEKLQETEVIIFDKTGSLTIGQPKLKDVFLLKENSAIFLRNDEKDFYLKLAASLSKKSRHVISQAISQSYEGNLEELPTLEIQGFGLESIFENKVLKLGKKDFCNIKNHFESDENSLNCFMKFGENELVFLFEDALKEDATTTLEQLKKLNKKIILLSGDNKKIVTKVAKELGISEFYFEQNPLLKVQFLEKLKAKNQKFIMIGDGLNDAPALSLSDVSISFSKASDLSQNIADVIIQGQKLMPIFHLIKDSKKAVVLMKENLFIALIYNLIAVPFAIAGYVVPLIAAIAMSTSSLLVLFNSLRINKK